MVDSARQGVVSINKTIEEAYKVGQSIDLSACAYGKNKIIPSYYHFLAGFCLTRKITRVLEVGTFMGGSSLAMHKGITANEGALANIVTVDVEPRDTQQINNIHEITRIIGDPLANPILNKILDKFDGKPIDLLFLDSTKKGRIVMSQLATFILFLRPTFVVLDDITLNDSMERMWKNVETLFKEYSLNLASDYPQIRKMAEINAQVVRHPGFGIIDYRAYLHSLSDN